jgi:superfamily II DNA/RNA helicase
LIALLAAGELNLEHLQHLVLDEADRMLDMGFYMDISRIISYLPKKRQTLLFSATMPPKIRTLAQKFLVSPQEVNLAVSKPAEGIDQQAYLVYDNQKLPLVRSILKNDTFTSVIIFASTRENVKKLEIELKRAGLQIKAFHSDLEQNEREAILREFKNRQLRIIIGTDILSRGIDVEGISLVINYDVPPDAEDYVHRIGRTARAETTGTAITFVSEKDKRKFASIENLIGREVRKIALPDELGPGPVFLAEGRTERPTHKKKFFNKSRNKFSSNKSSYPGKPKRH